MKKEDEKTDETKKEGDSETKEEVKEETKAEEEDSKTEKKEDTKEETKEDDQTKKEEPKKEEAEKEKVIVKKPEKRPFVFNIADGGFTELHTLWLNEERAAKEMCDNEAEIWHRKHDYWLLHGIVKYPFKELVSFVFSFCSQLFPICQLMFCACSFIDK